ncbi:cytochrome P450 4C1-like [Belonocnema kinseyi]|uniref:cytochrome P450 4C1-like n=1 Tax=Belonocnema kinseyi TaxID=2817044 RepID=UPI00143D663D|nr:cytochrome P450 4C1-like [Belonocnema kinseyi]
MFTSVLVIVTSILALTWIFTYFFGSNAKLKKLASRFPGPSSIPIVGNAYLLIGNTEDDTNTRKPFLDLMMTDNKLSDAEIREEVATIMFAGFDTSAGTLAFVLLMLASHPDIQEEVYEEIYQIYGPEDPKDVPVIPEDLPKLIILERVIKETMRLFPIAPFVARHADDNLDLGGFTLPKDCIPVISILPIHRNEKYWPDPLKFDPDRFLPEEVTKRHPDCYLPFSSGPRNCIVLLNFMMHQCEVYPSPFRFWLLNKLLIFTSDADQIKIIFRSKQTADKASLYNIAKPWVGEGLITSSGSTWHGRRKLIQPTFHHKILNSFIETFQTQSIVLTNEIASHVDRKEFDVSEIVAFRTLNFICETTMGTSIMTNYETSKKYFESIKIVMQVFVDRSVKIWLNPDIIFNRTKLSKEFYSSIKYMHDVSNEVIRNRRKEMDKRGIETDDTNKRQPFLDLMIADNKLSDAEIREEVDTIMFAGFDTSAGTICFVLLMLASHPNIQEQVYEEIYQIYGSEDPEDVPVKPEDLPKLITLERVIKETMRLFPIVPFFARRVDEDLVLGDYTLPKDSIPIVSILPLHRNEKYWPDPLKFDPDRFLPEEVAKRHPDCYYPFSGGPRNCIGQVYAMMSMKVLLTTLLRKYILKKDNIKPVKDIRLKYEILLRSAEPITMRIEKRVKNNNKIIDTRESVQTCIE